MKTISTKKMKIKLISLVLSTLLLFFSLIIKKVNFQILKFPYLVVVITTAVILITFSILMLVLNRDINQKFKYYYYQVLDFVQILVFALAIIQLVFLFWFFPATVQMSSMTPTLYEEDNLIIKVGKSKIDRFDIVVIEVKDMETYLDPDNLIIKRVIGLPGDNFKYRNGKLILIKNGEEIVIEENFLYDENGQFKQGSGFSTYTSDFLMADRCHINGKACDFTNGVAIPDDYYFVLGDNRGNNYSYDSRSFGLIHRTSIVGSAKYRMNNIFNWERLK